jgi:3-hydroxyisobutyrate dehydrogenase-like beta-hydroxyacid dehydrogenase
LVGYGKVGKILARALREKGLAWVGAWDILFRERAQGAAMKARAGEDRVEACESLAALLAHSDILISAVTASNALDVAVEAAPSIRAGAFFLELNSASPEDRSVSGSKRAIRLARIRRQDHHGSRKPRHRRAEALRWRFLIACADSLSY